MLTKRISVSEVWFPSLPDVPSESFVNDKRVSRAEFMSVRSAAIRVIADETHSSAGKTARHAILEVAA